MRLHATEILAAAALPDSQPADSVDNLIVSVVDLCTPAQSAWLPIESAPKNGNIVLGFCDKRICTQGVVKAMWSSRKGFWASPDGAEGYDLTHWMPLPAPPTQQVSAEDENG